MIIQAIALLDDIVKERNTYSMRLREWFGWHFPELGKIVSDPVMYAKALKLMGHRSNAKDLNFGDILPDELEADVKAASIISMGTEISDNDVANIGYLADQVITISEYCDQLNEYLKNRMNAIAPNLTVMVGELVGARLIAHAGSLINLAKQPASTVQILGAEKALFRALKTKKETPKYGLIYRASMVGQASTKNKGKISRVLAAKTALSVRVDALGESSEATIAVNDFSKVQERLRRMEGGAATRISGTGKSSRSSNGAYQQPRVAAYNTSNDAAMETVAEPEKKKKKKEKKEEVEENGAEESPAEPEKKKKKKQKEEKVENGDDEAPAEPEKKKKKKKEKEPESEEPEPEAPKKRKTDEDGEEKKKKKKKKTAEE
jgi:nucleolar protein 58